MENSLHEKVLKAMKHEVSCEFKFLLTLATQGLRFLPMLQGNEKPPSPKDTQMV